VRSRHLMTTALAGVAGAIWSETSRVTLRFNVKRGPSLRCWIFGHEDWVRRAPGRLYLECLDCGRETPGWTTAQNQRHDATPGPSAPDVILSRDTALAPIRCLWSAISSSKTARRRN
jgi:hypothetical protein